MAGILAAKENTRGSSLSVYYLPIIKGYSKEEMKEGLKELLQCREGDLTYRNGIMGIPISFMDKFCPEQFEIIGCTESEGKGLSNGLWNKNNKTTQPLINKKRIYKRIFINRKDITL